MTAIEDRVRIRPEEQGHRLSDSSFGGSCAVSTVRHLSEIVPSVVALKMKTSNTRFIDSIRPRPES